MGVLQVRVDDDLKELAIKVYSKLGLDLSTAIRMFLKKSIVEGGLPFNAKLDEKTLSAILAIEEMRDISETNGNRNMTLDDINEEIRLAREERKKKRN